MLGADWQEFRPTEIPKSTTGWHLIWLGGKVVLFEIVRRGNAHMLVNLNNGGRLDLDNKTFYDIALNAAPPERVNMTDLLERAQNAVAVPTAEMDAVIHVEPEHAENGLRDDSDALPMFGEDTPPRQQNLSSFGID